MSDLLQVSDLEKAKLHDTFHSEVVTGKDGGLSTGANIDYATNAVTGQAQKTLPKVINDLDWSYVGKFADGVTFTKKSDFSIDSDGVQWIYAGSDQFPKTVPPATVPSEPTYQAVHVKSASAISNANGGSVQDFIDSTDARYTTVFENVSDMIAASLDGVMIAITLGYYAKSDGGGDMYIITAGVPDGLGKHDIGGGFIAKTLSEEVTPKQIGWDNNKFGPSKILNAINAGYKFKIPVRISSLESTAAKWFAGEKYPIAIFGDSTTDGRGTTTNGVDLMTQFNTLRMVSGVVPDGLVYDHNDTEAPNSYPNIFQRMCRQYFSNSILRIYNAGYRSQTSEWAISNVYNAVYGNTTYNDCKMLCLNFGINDTYYKDDSDLYNTVYANSKALILDAYSRNVQPVLFTTNYISTNDVNVLNVSNVEISYIVDKAKKDLAMELNIELVDMYQILSDYISKNNDGYGFYDIAPDGVHLNDLGALKQAEWLLKIMSHNTIPTVGNGNQRFDGTYAGMRLTFPSATLSKSSPIYGINSVMSNIVISPNELLETGISYNLVDLFVWNEGVSTELIYHCSTSPRNYDSSAMDNAKLPAISVSAKRFTLNNFNEEVLFADIDPAACTEVNEFTLDRPFRLCRLKYGLNRIRLLMPSVLETKWKTSSGGVYFGWFEFAETRSQLAAVNGNSAPSLFEYPVVSNVMQGITSMYHINIKSGAYRYSHMLPELLDKSNVVSASARVSRYTVLFSMDFTPNTGVILCRNLMSTGVSVAPLNRYHYDKYLVAYYTGTTLDIVEVSSTGARTVLGTVAVGSTANYIDKHMSFLFSKNGDSITLTLTRLNPKTDVITVTYSASDADDTNYRILSKYSAGVCGGLTIDEAVQTSGFSVNYIKRS